MAERTAVLVLLAGLAAGCIDPLGQAETRVGEVLGDCVVPVPPGVSSWSAPVSLEYPGHSLWIWDSVTLDDGRVVTNVAAEVSRAASACDGVVLASDPAGDPRSLLPLTEEEQRENAERGDGRTLALLPSGGFTHEGAGYLYYERTLLGPGIFDSELLGTGLCVLEPGVEPSSCRRVVAGGSDILFSPAARPLNQGGLVDGERALIFGCRRAAYLSAPCTVTGVPLGAVEDPHLYAYLGGNDHWVLEPENAAIVLDWTGAITLSPFRGRFIVTLFDVFETRFDLAFADRPTGEFGQPIALFHGLAPSSFFPSGGREHSGLREGSDDLHVTYFTNHEGQGFGLHLASFRVNPGLEGLE
ncbi:MAG TPA: hypothetical protein VFV94_15530 [Polyangiaceae bacterium]|nr:hypothetical protein [Polyangiaceae bacterium]